MRRFLRIFAFALLPSFAPALWAAGDLSEDMVTGALWQMPQQDFGQKYLKNEYGSWVDPEKTTMRIVRTKLTIGEIKLGETIIKWKDDKPASMQIMLYNKGDNGLINEEDFNGKIADACEKLTAKLGVQAREYKPGNKESAVKMKVWQWTWDGGFLSLEASSSGSKARKNFEPEFIRLRFSPKAGAANDAERATRGDLKSHVKIQGKRVCIEGIPMVDQGEKGYCAVATAARIFSYYGSENVDQHELASIADTSANGGTSATAMKDAIRKIGTKFQIRVREIDELIEVKDYQRLVKAYNREAKKLGSMTIEDDINGYMNFWQSASGEVLKASRAGTPSDIERWMKPIRTWVNMGVPVLWTVHLGLVPEPMHISQSRGGHMRLIIGYDDEKKTILFSDSWGAEHTCKEMPMADAIAITTGRSVLVPSR